MTPVLRSLALPALAGFLLSIAACSADLPLDTAATRQVGHIAL